METESITENVSRGIIGAIIGCFLGGIVWLVLGYFGYVAYLAGLLIIFLGVFGYKKGAGTISIKGLYIVSLIAIITALLATYINWGLLLVNDYNYYFGLTGTEKVTILEMLPVTHEIIFSDPETQSVFIRDMLFSILFIGLPVILYIINFHRELRYSQGEEPWDNSDDEDI